MESSMTRTLLSVLVLSLFSFTAAGAVPLLKSPQAGPASVIEVGSKSKSHSGKHKGHNRHAYKHGGKYAGKYHYGNRNWSYRYRYRPLGWNLYGCVEAGPFWYCP
jgi:hypothetical protein